MRRTLTFNRLSFDKISSHSIGLFLAGCLFFLSLFVPTRYQPVKLVFLMLTLSFLILRGKIKIHFSVLLWILLMMASDFFSQVRGFIEGGVRSLSISTVTIFWPVCYTLIISCLDRFSYFIKIIKIMIFATWVIIFHIFTLIGSMLFGIDSPLAQIDTVFRVVLDKNSLSVSGFSSSNLATLFFTTPFIFSLWGIRAYKDFFKGLSYPVICFLLLIVVIISSRVGFLMALGFTLLIYLLTMNTFYNNRFRLIKIFFVVIIVLIAALYIFNINLSVINFEDISKDFIAHFNFTENHSSSVGIRVWQIRLLINKWKEKPLLGWGMGVGIREYTRNEDFSDSFESIYIKRLFQTGIIGFAIYSSYILWIIFRCISIIRKKTYLSKITYSILLGFICFMTANATNPYLDKFDCLWVLYLPLAIINYDLCTNKDENDENKEATEMNYRSCQI